jgi:hypothetical protein
VAIGVHARTVRTDYLDAKRAFNKDATMLRVAEALRPKTMGPKRDQGDNGTTKTA